MPHGFTTQGPWLRDRHGRSTLLRGVNFGGNGKVPATPDGSTQRGADFDGWRTVSFVGRPAPLDELDGHLRQIAHWGFNTLRLVTTWEAIEHAGPGEYDEEYLEYLTEVVRRAGRHGLLVFIDPHQDVWSRWTGGDGAPYWCFAEAGLRPEQFRAAQAVALNDRFWARMYDAVPVATMFTLLFGGDAFGPSRRGVQERLQASYVNAVTEVARRVAGLDNVLGYDTLNEPSAGYIAKADLNARPVLFPAPPGTPTALQRLAAADGHPVEVDGVAVVNPDGVSIWEDGCPWRAAGVWDFDASGRPVVLDPTFFTHRDGAPVKAFRDFQAPLFRRLRRSLREVHRDAILFVDPSPWDLDTEWDDPDPLVVNARHWYDVNVLWDRRFSTTDYHSVFAGEPLHGIEDIAAHYTMQIDGLAQHGNDAMSGRPLLLGEVGVPQDLNDGEALRGDDTALRAVTEATYRALDATLVHSTHWNYTPTNTHAHGDGWNLEDFSIYSVDDDDDPEDPDSGGRAVASFCRPHLVHAAGVPIGQRFDPADACFELEIESDPVVSADFPTEIYVPRLHYPDGVHIRMSDGEADWDPSTQTLRWSHPGSLGKVSLVLRAR